MIYLIYTFIALVVGVLSGLIDTIFSYGLAYVGNYRDTHLSIIYLLPLAGLLIIYLYRHHAKPASGGMSLVFDAHNSMGDKIPIRLIPYVTITTWITHLFGGSAGREGVAVQLGATIADNIYRYFKKYIDRDIVIATGIAAGFSGLFGTPMAATVFSMEVMRSGQMKYHAIYPALLSAYIAKYTSEYLGLAHFHFHILDIPELTPYNILLVIIASFAFAFAAYLFAKLLAIGKSFKYNPYIKIAIISIILSIIMIMTKGRYAGLGTNIISEAFNTPDTILFYDFIVKLLLTVITIAIGFQGGEVTPLFAIGASLGIILGNILGISPILLAGIGYATVFGGATNTYLTAVFIGAEVFGYDILPYLFIASTITFLFSGNISIYAKQIIEKERRR